MSPPGCGPLVPHDRYSTQEAHPSWFPLVPSDLRIWASPLETDQDFCPGWPPPVPLYFVSLQEDFSPCPLTPRFRCFPASKIMAIILLWCFFVWYNCLELQCETILRLEEFIINRFRSIFFPHHLQT